MFESLRTLVPVDDNPWNASRRAPRQSDESLNGTTRQWLRRLPASRRPLRLCELYPRVANRVAWCWLDPVLRAQAIEDLLEDRRGGRRGFPACVVRELQRLRDCEAGAGGAGNLAGPPWWRVMVKAAGD